MNVREAVNYLVMNPSLLGDGLTAAWAEAGGVGEPSEVFVRGYLEQMDASDFCDILETMGNIGGGVLWEPYYDDGVCTGRIMHKPQYGMVSYAAHIQPYGIGYQAYVHGRLIGKYDDIEAAKRAAEDALRRKASGLPQMDNPPPPPSKNHKVWNF